MKKLVLIIGVVCFLLTSCGGGQKKVEETKKDECCKTEQKCQMTEEQKAEMEAFNAKWNDWANLDDATKTELIAKAKACIDKKAECCKSKEGEKSCCKGKEGGEGCKGDGCKNKEEGKACCKDKKEGEKTCDGKHEHKEGCKHEGGKEGCNHEHKEGCKGEHKCQLTEEQKAEMEVKMAEMKAKWAAFETLTLDEQKELIDMKMNCGKKACQGQKEGCKHGEGKEGCKHEHKDGEACQQKADK